MEVARQTPRWEDAPMDGGNGGKTWWVYMISCRGGKIYTGTSLDPEARYAAHRSGKGAAFTRANPPVALLRCVPFASRSEACRAEAALKKIPREKKLSWAGGIEDADGSTGQ
jgi:putative endonuclease